VPTSDVIGTPAMRSAASIGLPASSPWNSLNCHCRTSSHKRSAMRPCSASDTSSLVGSGSRRDQVVADGSGFAMFHCEPLNQNRGRGNAEWHSPAPYSKGTVVPAAIVVRAVALL
jgi:hypothetical protein